MKLETFIGETEIYEDWTQRNGKKKVHSQTKLPVEENIYKKLAGSLWETQEMARIPATRYCRGLGDGRNLKIARLFEVL